ncbi:MAG TPA: helix-turn-helix transcriptional regulator [Verrucomicrobiae bacterium]|nr:helix-turn-helix transcriptional regulator [Verrucomicrobiae bacterium]
MDQDTKLLRAFGLALRQERERLGVSQDVLADLAGLHRTYIGSVERGERNLSLKNIVAIARALGIPASELVERAESLLQQRPSQETSKRR